MALCEVNFVICKRFCKFLQNSQINRTIYGIVRNRSQTRNYCFGISNSESKEAERDPLEDFLKEKNQRLMVAITDLKGDKFFHTKKVREMRAPAYKLLTDTEVEVEQEAYARWANQHLHMPPVMNPRQEIDQIFAKDPDIADALPSNFVFVDISMNVKDRDRKIVVRSSDGTLRAANWGERDRINQIYNPAYGRQLFPPKMFESEQLEEILPQQNYLYLLERASNQYEPDHPSYIRISQRIFEHVCSTEAFDKLRSTRYFGPMAFYFCWVKKIEPLLIDMIKREGLSHGSMFIQLYDNIHNIRRDRGSQPLLIIKNFCEKDASSKYKGQLELALTHYEAKNAKQMMQQTS